VQSFGGALDKTAIYDEEDQLLIISEMYVALIVFTHKHHIYFAAASLRALDMTQTHTGVRFAAVLGTYRPSSSVLCVLCFCAFCGCSLLRRSPLATHPAALQTLAA